MDSQINVGELPAGRVTDGLIAEIVFGCPCPPMPAQDDPGWVWRAVEIWNDGLPNYSTHLAVAWNIVERFKEAWCPHRDRSLNWCSFEMFWMDGEWAVITEQDYDGPNEWVAANTPALAICRAALRIRGRL